MNEGNLVLDGGDTDGTHHDITVLDIDFIIQ
jgi:hypothetical protein